MTHGEALRTLNLDRGCSRVEIRQAYLDMVKVWHPDRFQHDPGLRAKADRALRDVNQAYRVLQGRVRQDGPGVHQEDPGTRQTVETPQAGVHRTVSQVPARRWSPYRVRFMLGNGWDDGSFRRDATYDELDQDVVFEESAQADSTQHTRLTIALRSAADGRTGRRTVTPFVLPK